MKKLLDVGCGSGGYINLSYYKKLEQEYKIYGIDFLKKNIRSIEKRYPQGSFKLGDVHVIPFPDKSFDAVLARHVLEHVYDIKKTIKEIKRICKKNAEVFIAIPHPRFEHVMMHIVPHYMKKRHHHERIFNRDEFIKMLAREGFRIEKITNDKWPIFVLDLFFGLLARISKKVKMQEQTGIFIVGENDYTQKNKLDFLYRYFYLLINVFNNLFPFMNRIIPFEIKLQAKYEK